jgi:hypothetical protein
MNGYLQLVLNKSILKTSIKFAGLRPHQAIFYYAEFNEVPFIKHMQGTSHFCVQDGGSIFLPTLVTICEDIWCHKLETTVSNPSTWKATTSYTSEAMIYLELPNTRAYLQLTCMLHISCLKITQDARTVTQSGDNRSEDYDDDDAKSNAFWMKSMYTPSWADLWNGP